MKAKNKYFTIKEYGIIYQDDKTAQTDVGISLDKKIFLELENFILKTQENGNSDLSDFMTISYKKPYGKVFRIQNYVGMIQLRNGLVIEILPKIYFNDNSDDIKKSRDLLLKMLKTLKDSPFKKYDNSNLRTEKLPIFEIFIKMFLDELSYLIKAGLKADYIKQEENLKFLKGKLKIKEQIIFNTVHKERFFVQYDDYMHDIPENRLIKSTLIFLLGITHNIENQKNIRLYMGYFDEVKESYNFEKDFSKCSATRLLANYEKIIRWCRVFLKRDSFLNYKGSIVTYALLFPMEKLFESYVAHKIKRSGVFKECVTQHQKYHLAQNGTNIFKLKPDIFAKKENSIYILDTKWKELSSDSTKNYGISQADMYQMLSYAKIYENKEGDRGLGTEDRKRLTANIILYLIYPKTEFFTVEKVFKYHDVNTIELHIFPADLESETPYPILNWNYEL